MSSLTASSKLCRSPLLQTLHESVKRDQSVLDLRWHMAGVATKIWGCSKNGSVWRRSNKDGCTISLNLSVTERLWSLPCSTPTSHLSRYITTSLLQCNLTHIWAKRLCLQSSMYSYVLVYLMMGLVTSLDKE